MKRLLYGLLFSVLFFGNANGQNWDQMIKAVASDRGESDNFGFSVSVSGDYAIVGAYQEDEDTSGGNTILCTGSAYIFHYNGTTWEEQQKIVASDRQSYDFFGYSVSISGDYAIVGAFWEDHDATGLNAKSSAGSAYIFVRSGTTWEQEQKIVASDRAKDDRFGWSVSISGDYAIVGAYQEDEDASGGNNLSDAGSAYIFFRSDKTWTQQQKIVASDRAVSDQFGSAVSLTTNYAIVGAFVEDEDSVGSNTMSGAGSAYIFVRSETTWTEQQKIVASDRAIDDNYGYSVSIAGKYAIVGSERDDEDAEGNNYEFGAGSAYIYIRSGTTWSEQQKIVASDRDNDDLFGYSVSITGDHAIVGAYREGYDPFGINLQGAGAAYIYTRSGTTWSEPQKIVANDRARDDAFGISVSMTDDYAFVGAIAEDHDASGGDSLADAGSTYIFFYQSVSDQLSVNDTTIQDLEIVCFNAYDTIKVAENGDPVILESGSEATFIAGTSILFFPGFSAESGSFMDAHITSDSTFCDGASGSPVVNRPVEKSKEGRFISELQPDNSFVKTVKVFPNPNNGQFTIGLTNFEERAVMSICNLSGAKVYSIEIRDNTNQEINLSTINKGVYFVNVTSGIERFTKKMIIN